MNEETIRGVLQTQATLLGQDVRDVVRASPEGNRVTDERLSALVSQLNAGRDLSAGPAMPGKKTWHTGSASLTGCARGICSASVSFGRAGTLTFTGSMWTSPIAVEGGGAGTWSVLPRDGEELSFAWCGGAVAGGGVHILWDISGTVVGSMVIFAAGIGTGGGHGFGTWTSGR